MPLHHPASPLGRWLAPPVFPSEELTERARLLHSVAWTGMIVTTGLLAILLAVQPDAAGRILFVLAAIDLVGLAVLEVSRRGHPRRAAVGAIAVLLAAATLLAPSGGGIRSPAATAYFAFVLLAGVLLGPRAAFRTAVACALLATGLVAGELLGLFEPGPVRYGAIGLLVMNFFYVTVVVALTGVASRSMSAALGRAESELTDRRAAETRLGMAMDAAAMGVWEYDQGTSEYRLDAHALTLFGLPEAGRDTFSDEEARDLVHPEDRDLVGKLARMGENETGSCRHRLIWPDGSIRHIRVFGRGARPAPGKPVRVIGMMVDVTATSEAEIERERLLYDLGERIKELTLLQRVARLLHARWFFDRSVLSEIVRAMPAGWQYPEVCEARISYQGETFATAGWRETPWRQTRAFETSTGRGVIEVAYTRDMPPADEGPFLTEERALLDSLAELLTGHLEGEHAEQLRRDLESQLRQSQKMEALGTLAGGIAHDFNNILTAIGGNVDLALADADSATVRDYLLEVRRAHERARDLVKRILFFSRRQESQKKAVQLAPVVEETLRLLRASVGREIRIETDFTAPLPPVLADATQMHQVLMNLATNAAYAMGETGGVLTVRLDERTTLSPHDEGLPADLSPGRYVRLTMRDTGAGMAPEILSRLFEPFFTTKGVLGTGLGLSVVHGIVHEHGGGIRVESEPGRGTAFELYFPVAVEIDEDSPVPDDGAHGRGHGEHILCVDDEEAVLFVVTRTLERMGFRTTGCSHPAEALQTFRERPHEFDAVLSDMGMPGMTGLELARALRAIRSDIPIAIASGYARPQTATRDISAWIEKPPSREELAGTLARIMNGTG